MRPTEWESWLREQKWFIADSDRLAENKFTPEGGTVWVDVTPADGNAVLEVKDTGTGIAASALPHIFERFYRADEARSRELSGAGLGLSLVQCFVNALGGQVEVESTLGQGALFRLSLPAGHRR